MSDTFRLSDYQIQIGKKNIIERQLQGLLGDDPESSKNHDKVKKSLKEVLRGSQRSACPVRYNPQN